MKHLITTTAITPPKSGKSGPRKSAPKTGERTYGFNILRLLLAGLYFLLGAPHERCQRIEPYEASRPLNRTERHSRQRRLRLARSNNRNLSQLRKVMPKGLTPNQFNERCTRLSHMGRFQVYDWLYYRWEFWRIGAIAQRCRSPQGGDGPVSDTTPFGLSAANIWPD